jgi:hypothetical protein
MLEQVRTAMVSQDGRQPGDPRRGVRAVIAAMNQDPPPQRLVLGSDALDAVVRTMEDNLADIRRSEPLSRGADFPVAGHASGQFPHGPLGGGRGGRPTS